MSLWTVAHQGPLSMGFSRQEYWSGLPFPPLGGLPNLGIFQNPESPTLAGRCFTPEPPGKLPLQLVLAPKARSCPRSPQSQADPGGVIPCTRGCRGAFPFSLQLTLPLLFSFSLGAASACRWPSRHSSGAWGSVAGQDLREVAPGRGRCALPQGGGVGLWASGQCQAAPEAVGSDPCARSQLGGGDRRVLLTSGAGAGFSTSGATDCSRLVPCKEGEGPVSCTPAKLECSHSSDACASLGGPGFPLDSPSCVAPVL